MSTLKKSTMRIVFVLAFVVLAVLPVFNPPAYYQSIFYLIFYWMALSISWNLLSGYSGYFSFGHGAFFGAGVYATAVITGKLELPFLWAIPISAAVAALIGFLLGFVIFRVKSMRGELFALLTMAVGFILGTIVLNSSIDGGPGVNLANVKVLGIFSNASANFYFLALIVCSLTVWLAYEIFYSKLGLGLFAIHDDEDVAEVMGVPTFKYKLLVFSLSSALAGLIGGVHAVFISYVTVGETFNITVPLTVILMSALGGTRHWFGPAVGAIVVTLLLYSFTAGDMAILGRALIGLILVLVILFMPDGILGYILKKSATRQKAKASTTESTDHASHIHAPQQTQNVRPINTERHVLLEVKGLAKSFAGLRATDNVSMQIYEGEILGLVGPNGSGKSTFINLVSGHYRSDAGSIQLNGVELVNLPAHLVARQGIARTYQIPRPFNNLTVLNNVALAAMFGSHGLNREAAEDVAKECLSFVGLEGKAASLPDDLNLHQRKFLEFARALASRPKLLFLDEVLSGLTPSEIDSAIELIRAIRSKGTTIVFVEHVMRAVMELTDRIVVLNQGRLIAQGLPEVVMRNEEVITAYLGQAHVGT